MSLCVCVCACLCVCAVVGLFEGLRIDRYMGRVVTEAEATMCVPPCGAAENAGNKAPKLHTIPSRPFGYDQV